ncbi:MAG TPA: hypothetical protein VFE35_03740 [Candidatus Cybelea sp.]|nr:hypothetical protein [Candidatus Cybelea sp.]
MRIVIAGQYALSISVAAALLTGCGGYQSPIAGPGTTSLVTTGKKVQPASGSQHALIYAYERSALIYDYELGKMIDQFQVQPSMTADGICSDAKGDVFFTGNVSETTYISRYPYGSTLASGTVSFQHGTPTPGGCSVDDASGNVATVATGWLPSPFDLVVFPDFQEPPIEYNYIHGSDVLMSVAYDGSGDLFLLGISTTSSDYYLAELLKGKTEFMPISVGLSLDRPYAIQWDGKYLAVTALDGTGSTHWIYRLKVSGSQATLVGIVKPAGFTEPRWRDRTWIQPNVGIMIAGKSTGNIGVWKYPRGGRQIHRFITNMFMPTVTVAAPGGNAYR